MAKTLLNCVNEILTRTSIIAGDAGELTTLTDSARQRPIDIAIQVINEGNDDLYAASTIAQPNEQAEGTITLATGTRAYDLHASLVQLRWPLVDKTNNQYIQPFPGGYNAMLLYDPEQDDTGLPHFAAIRPTDGKLHLDRAPTSQENGKVYTYQFDKDISMALAADTVPYRDAVFRAMVPAWVQLWKRDMRQEFDQAIYAMSVGRAAKLLVQKHARTSYSPR